VAGTIVEVAVGLVVLVVLGALALGATRLQTLAGRVGSFVCGARAGQPGGDAWVAGVAQYGAGRLDWWRSWSLSPRPVHSWQRTEFVVTGRAPIPGAARTGLYLVQCQHRGVHFELTMSPEAYAGLTSWLEAAPPSAISRVI